MQESRKAPALWRASSLRSLVPDEPGIMAILNVTPDSFADGGRFASPEEAAGAAHRAAEEGAAAIDVGGESTRPGAQRVPAAEQTRRVVPVIELIRRAGPAAGLVITVDTTSAEVARAALDAGADAVNDVSAGLDDAEMLLLCARRGAGIILMHRLLPPAADRYSDRYDAQPRYEDVVAEVVRFLGERAAAALAAGVAPESLVVDPGLGFGKSVAQNMELIERTREIAAMGYPVLSGLSRKSFVGRVSLGRDSMPSERLAGTLALSTLHMRSGARLFRVHDVREHAAALRAAWGPAAL